MRVQASITSDLDQQVYKHQVKIEKMEEEIQATESKAAEDKDADKSAANSATKSEQ